MRSGLGAEIVDPVTIDEFFGETPDGTQLARRRAGASPPACWVGEPVTVVVGPEGGLTDGRARGRSDRRLPPDGSGPRTRCDSRPRPSRPRPLVAAARLRGIHG